MGIAESWEVAPDGLSWIFHIRKGIKFHNGDTLTAKDVKFTLDRFGSKDALNVFIRDTQERVEVVDDYTVRVYTKGIQPQYVVYVDFENAQQGFIMPKDYFEKVGIDKFKLSPVGTGPFKFVRHVPADMVEYQAVANHWRQTPAFKTLTLILVPEETTRLAMLRTGQLDATEISIESVPEMEAAGFKTRSLSGVMPSIYIHGAYDSRAKGMPAADVRVRQALSLAINRDEIGKTFFQGKIQPPMPPYMRLNQAEIDLTVWKAEAAKAYRYDLEEAKRLLKEAGYANGFSIKLHAYPDGGAPWMPKLAEVIQGYWLKIGVKTEIVPMQKATLQGWYWGGPNRSPVDALVGQVSLNSPGGSPSPARGLMNIFTVQGNYVLLSGSAQDSDAGQLLKLATNLMTEPDINKRKEMLTRALRTGIDTWVFANIGTVPGMSAFGPRVDLELPVGAHSISMHVEYTKHLKP